VSKTTEYTGQMTTAEELAAAQQSGSIAHQACGLSMALEASSASSVESVCRSVKGADISVGIGISGMSVNTASGYHSQLESVMATTTSGSTQCYHLGNHHNITIQQSDICEVGRTAWSNGRVRYISVNLVPVFICAAIRYAVQITIYYYSYINYLEWSVFTLGGSISALIGDVDHYYRKVRVGTSLENYFGDAQHRACGIYITSLVQ